MKYAVRFVDDAGLHWQIDRDLHLQRVDHLSGMVEPRGLVWVCLPGRPSPYHRGAGRSPKVVDAGRQTYAGRMRSAPFDAVAALRCCT